MASWRQWTQNFTKNNKEKNKERNQVEQNRPRNKGGWRKSGPLAVAFFIALTLVYYGAWTPAHGQESPLATPVPAEATPAPVEAAPTAPPPPIISAQLPSLSGLIHDSSGSPLPGLVVTAYQRNQANWLNKRQTTTNSAGEFRFPWMPSGTYRLAIQDPKNVYATTYYPNAGDIEEGSDIVVTGTPVTGIDAAVVAGGQITGTLSWPDGPAPFDSTINVYYVTGAPITSRLNSHDDLTLAPELLPYRFVASQNFTETVVDFAFPGLAAGKYRVCAQATALHSTQSECFDNAVFGIHATDVVVTDGATVANVEIKLGDGADTSTLVGLITGLDQTPAAGVGVDVIADPKEDFFYTPQPFHATTDVSGTFRLDQMPFGNYSVRFSDSSGHYLARDYRLPTEQAVKSLVALDRNGQVTITAAITPAAIITGYTTIDGINAGMSGQVSALGMGPQGWFPGGTGTIVASTGAYSITGLTAGNYRLQYAVDLPVQPFYGAPGATLETATDVAAVTGTTTGNINMDLTPYLAGVPFGSISGQVAMDNAPQPNIIKVSIFDAAFDCCIPSAPVVTTVTDGQGHYTVAGLAPGQYKVGVGAPDQAIPSLYAINQPSYELAAKYLIGNPADGLSSQTITDVNFALGPTGSISRTVHRPDDTPVVAAPVNIYQQVGDSGNWPLVASTKTDAAGNYSFKGLLPGIYQVCIAAPGITEATCGGRSGQGKGIDAVVNAGQEAAGIDILDVP